ncbi:hypothetical protein CMV_007253 [Castanea mollissima]|uniref:Uncharacterized protein n=1 Tax=Castanea mollissima TaxID=60419 RepID=A0A8J4RM66_9ROSI|nr:hypothetical protein CMV_007253 [Castanea mollissima]
MDSIVRAFWWGHESGERKLHMLNWDKICHLRRYRGHGIKKFHPMNQAMLAKQYWRINQNPKSLLARTYKAKYHPSRSIQEQSAKPRHSWFWKNIRSHGSKVLREGKWCVGDGINSPLTHPNWFHSPNLDLNNLRFLTSTVRDLIDHNTKSWKVDMIRNIYPYQQAMEILQLPISTAGSAQEQVLWKYAKNGVYQVKLAYELLLKEWEGTSHNAQD